MSNILENHEPLLLTDSRLLQTPIMRPVLRGPKKILYKQWPPISASKSGISFNCSPPLPNCEIDRNIRLLCPCRVSCTAVWTASENGQYLAQPNKLGIRSFPIQKALSRTQMTLNNQGFSINIGDIISALEHFSTSVGLKLLDYSTTSTYGCCQAQKFSDLNLGIRSALSTFEDSISGIAPQNFPFTVYSNTAAALGNSYTASCEIDFVASESIFLSPCFFGDVKENYDSFKGIQNMSFDFEFQSTNPQFRMIAIDNTTSSGTDRAGTITGDLQITFTASDSFSFDETEPKLLVQYLQPQDPVNLDEKPHYLPYYSYDHYRTTHTAAIGSFASDIIKSEEIRLSRMPTKLFFWARKPNSTYSADPFTPDVFTSIESIKLFWNNRIVLPECHKSVLYEISVSNGLQYEYASWSGYKLNKNENIGGNFGTSSAQFGGTGAVLCIDVLDLGIDEQLEDNPNQQLQLFAEVTVKNISGASYTPDLYVLVLYDGIIKFENGLISTYQGVVDTTLPKNGAKNSARIIKSVKDKVASNPSYITNRTALINMDVDRTRNLDINDLKKI